MHAYKRLGQVDRAPYVGPFGCCVIAAIALLPPHLAAIEPTAEPECWAVNGHCYQNITSSEITWSDAKAAAQDMNFRGAQGHLATITSQEEQDFVHSLTPPLEQIPPFGGNRGWIGAFQAADGEPFEWVTGEPFIYENWRVGEPRGDYRNNYVELNWELQDWNDTADFDPAIDGFLMEYPVAAGNAYVDLTNLPDINGNGSPELAALRILSDGAPNIIVTDSDTNEHIKEISFDASAKTPKGITGLLDINGNGSPEVAVLLVKPNGTGQVVIRDAETGAYLGSTSFFGKNWQAKAITSQDLDGDGVSEISVLAEKDDGTEVVIQLKDSITGDEMNWIQLPLN